MGKRQGGGGHPAGRPRASSPSAKGREAGRPGRTWGSSWWSPGVWAKSGGEGAAGGSACLAAAGESHTLERMAKRAAKASEREENRGKR